MKLFLVRILSLILLFTSNFVFSTQDPIFSASLTTPSSVKKIKVAIASDIVPYQYEDKGKASGYVADVWRLWSERTGIEVEFLSTKFDYSEALVLQGDADVHAALANREKRKGLWDFGADIYSTPVTVYVHKDLKYIPSLDKLTAYKVGVEKNSNLKAELLAQNPNIIFHEYENWELMVQAFYREDIKTFISYDFVTFEYPGYRELNDLVPKYKRLPVSAMKPQFAVKAGNSDMFNLINDGFKLVTAADFKELDQKWFRAENDNVLTLAYSVGAEPYMGVDSEGKASGLFVDLWRLWARKTGNDIRFIPHTSGTSLEAVREGANHIHIGFPESLSVNTGLPRGSHLYTTSAKAFVYGTYDYTKGLQQFSGQSFGIFVGSPYRENALRDMANIELINYTNIDDAINASIKGDISGFITSSQMAKAKLESNNISHRFTQIPAINYETKIYSLVNENQKGLLQEISEGFELISQQELIEVENRWIQDPNERYFSAKKKAFRLTDAEQKWIEENPKMSVAIVKDWTPYEFIDSTGEAAGISRDIFDIASRLTGQKYDFIGFDTWEDLFNDFKNGQIDIVANITASDQRRAFANFTSEYWRTPWSVITHKSDDNISSIKKFYGKRVAIIQGYQIIKEIHDKHPQVIIHVVKDFNEGLELLKAGVIDGIVDLMNVSAQYIQDHSLYQYRIHVFEDMGSDNAHIGVKKSLHLQARILEKVVKSLSEKDVEAILKKWNKVDVVAGIKSEIYTRNITIAIGGSILIISLILLWNRKLKKEIDLRKSAELKLQHLASHDALTGLPNRSLLMDRIKQAISHHARNNKEIALLFLDLDGFKQVNDTFGHDVGDELLIQVGDRLNKIIRNSDTVARFGGDEFVVLATNLNEGKLSANLAEKIVLELSDEFVLSTTTVNIGVSIGISCFPEHGQGGTTLIKAADDAMYQVKANGKNNYGFAA